MCVGCKVCDVIGMEEWIWWEHGRTLLVETKRLLLVEGCKSVMCVYFGEAISVSVER